jgi:hypothetical protein
MSGAQVNLNAELFNEIPLIKISGQNEEDIKSLSV